MHVVELLHPEGTFALRLLSDGETIESLQLELIRDLDWLPRTQQLPPSLQTREPSYCAPGTPSAAYPAGRWVLALLSQPHAQYCLDALRQALEPAPLPLTQAQHTQLLDLLQEQHQRWLQDLRAES